MPDFTTRKMPADLDETLRKQEEEEADNQNMLRRLRTLRSLMQITLELSGVVKEDVVKVTSNHETVENLTQRINDVIEFARREYEQHGRNVFDPFEL